MIRANITEKTFNFVSALSNRDYTDLIVIHHTGGKDIDAYAEQIHDWHLNKGYSGIGYHFVVRKNGTIERGRPVHTIGSHTYGSNAHSIGIHLSGNFEEAQPTDNQIEMTAMLIANLCEDYNIPTDREHIKGHFEVDPDGLSGTSCPGKNLFAQLDTIVGKANWYRYNSRPDAIDTPAEPIKPSGDMLSAHFGKNEFWCRGQEQGTCHCNHSCKVNPRLLELLEQLRKNIGGKSIFVNSGYRCPDHNSSPAVGGASYETHERKRQSADGQSTSCEKIGQLKNFSKKIISDKKICRRFFLQGKMFYTLKNTFGGVVVENEKLKIFKVRGECITSEDDNFKTAENFSLDSAEEYLYFEVKDFLHDNFKNLDDDDIYEIIKKFLKKNKPCFVRENSPDNEIICYAEIEAEINLTDLNNFLKNFPILKLQKRVFELEQEVYEMKDTLETLQKNYQKYFPKIIDYTLNIQSNPKSADAYNERGIFYNDSLKNYEQAIEDYTHAIKLNPNAYWVYRNIGNSYFNLKQYTKAVEFFSKAISLNPNYAEAYNDRGRVYLSVKKFFQAISDFTQAIQIDSKFFYAYGNRGTVYKNLKNYDRAIKDFTQAIKINPNFADAYYSRGECYRSLKKDEDADKDFTKWTDLLLS